MICRPNPDVLEIDTRGCLSDVQAKECSDASLIHGRWRGGHIRGFGTVVLLEKRTAESAYRRSVDNLHEGKRI